MPKTHAEVPALGAELHDAELGDQRLSRRLGSLAERLAERPGESFPRALDDAELEGAYRFFGNAKVTPEAILAPHIRQTARRSSELKQVLVVHDTTQFEFGGQTRRPGLGRLICPGQGFFGHFALATSADGKRKPLGILALETVFRLDKAKPKLQRRSSDNRGESARWLRSVETAEAALGDRTHAIHVADREGDSYALLALLVDHRRWFVIRSFQDRILAGEDDARLRAVACAAKTTLRREVPLSPRPRIRGPIGERHPARRYRIATLFFAALRVELPRPASARTTTSPSLPVNVIHVFEREPPAGEPAVEWFLLTSLPINTPDEIAFAVDCYRGRWTIEEYFKALKTGCQYEKRQLESAHSLLNALAILAPVAWRLLLLRHLARSDEPLAATEALTPSQLDVLRAVARKPLPAKPTARDALLAVAALGGHRKANGDPGWLVVGRGMHDLLLLELGWRAREQAEL
jgi:hypothetical protein